MANTYSIMGLHLHYRLWIAEMNSDITLLRIFEDYVEELASKKNEPAVKAGIDNFEQHFVNLRKESDELRHEMHLIKMKLAAQSKETVPVRKKVSTKENHDDIKKRYASYRKTFNRVKKEFQQFASKWLK
jgi:hypothetical protein